MFSVSIKRYVLLPFGILCLVAAGAILERRLDVIWALKSRLVSVAQQPAKEPPSENLRSISSALVPLQLLRVSMPDQFGANKEAGAICTFGSRILISDRLGQFFSFALDERKVEALNWPSLENNHAQFLKSPKAKERNNFRVHGLACPERNGERHVFVAHEAFDIEAQATRFTVSMLRLQRDGRPTADGWKVLYRSAPVRSRNPAGYAGNSAGGRIVYDQRDALFISIGDYGLPADLRAENDPNLGAVILLDLASGAISRISSGHRNPQGLARLSSGELLSTEQGPRGGDELNRIVDGRDFGWPNVTYGTEYETFGWTETSDVGRHEGYEKPLFAFVPSVATTQILQVRNFHTRWNSDLLIASLKAGTLFRVRYEDGIVRYVEPIWIGPRLRDMVETDDGQIAIWTDAAELLLLSVDQAQLTADLRTKPAEKPPANSSCMGCHHVGPTNPSHLAPSLSKILGRKIGSDSFAQYSGALTPERGAWTEDNLRRFLAAPQEFSPGTTMAMQRISNAELDQVIRYLRVLD